MLLKLSIDGLLNCALFGKGTTLYYVILTDLKTKIIVRAILNSIHVRWSFKQYKGRDGVFFSIQTLYFYIKHKQYLCFEMEACSLDVLASLRNIFELNK